MTECRDREKLKDVLERRGVAEAFEFRKDDASGCYILDGYAATYEPYDCHGGPGAGGWVEQLDRRAFDATLAEQPDVMLLINHEGLPLARTKSGNLTLTPDNHGLRVRAELDPTDPDVQRIAPKMKGRGGKRPLLDEMSFAFRVQDQSWDTGYTHRTIRSLSLEKGDVSVVNYGMNPTTQVVLSDAIGALSELSDRELVELRKLDSDQVRRAAAVLQAIAGPVQPGFGGVKLQGAVRAKDTKEPYGPASEADYADPGYKSDGKKRYPLNTQDHVRAAWSYINMPKNQKGYTATQLSAIKGRIRAAAKKFGIEISDDSGEGKAGVSHIDQVVRGDGKVSLVAVMTDGSRVPLPSMAAQKALTAARGSFKGDGDDWDPADVESEDPHEVPYEVGAMGLVDAGPVPGNIVGGALAGQQAAFVEPSAEGDPHDTSFETEEKLSMDAHEAPYELGPYPAGSKIAISCGNGGDAGADPHGAPFAVSGSVSDRPPPAVGGGDPGRDAANVVTQGAPLGVGSGCDPGVAPSVGTEPVDEDGEYDWTSGVLEPSDPAQELDHALQARNADPHDTPTLGGAGGSFSPGGSWEPTNIEGGSVHSEDDGDDGERVELDLGMAEALERTIIHCYKLAEGNSEVRKTLGVARKQLHLLLGKPAVKTSAASDIQRKLDELRKEVGDPGTGTVSDGLKFIRSAGTAPVGYGGLLDHDPGLHMTTPGERLAKEAVEADRRARAAAAEADTAAERLKLARREAELNDVIRRHRKGA